MKLTWHIIRKDLLRDRAALVLWALLFIGQTGLGWFMQGRDTPTPDAMTYAQLAATSLVFLQFVMGYVLVTRLVQADALVGTVVFWRTRPVSAARLLAAKALSALLLFGLLPVLLLLPWWLYCGFGWREILWTSVETIGWQLLMIAPAFLVASLTDDLGRVLLWTLLLAIALMSWIVLLQASFSSWLGRDLGAIGPGRIYTKFWVAAVTLVLGVWLVAAHQFLTRRLVRSVTLAVACLGSVALVGQFFPRDWVPVLGQLHQPAVPAAPAAWVEALSFEVLPAAAIPPPEATMKRSAVITDTGLNLWMRVQGMPAGLYLSADRAAQAWTWPDGVRIARSGFYAAQYLDLGSPELRQRYSLPLPAEDPETTEWMKAKRAESDAKQKARGLPSLWRTTPRPAISGQLLHSYASLPHSFVDKMHREPPRYTTRFEATLYRPDPMAELPLQVGARAAYAGIASGSRWWAMACRSWWARARR